MTENIIISFSGGRTSAMMLKTIIATVQITSGQVQETSDFEPPKTIRIGEYDVPEPVHEPLEKGTEYWIAHFSLEELANRFKWYSDKFDNRVLENGLIHLTKEAAVIHAKALLSLTKAAE